VVVRIAADSENKLAEEVLFSLSKGFLNILDLVNKFKKEFFKRDLFLPLSRGRRRRRRGVNLLQRGCNRGRKRGKASPSSTSHSMDCKIRNRRKSSWRSARIRWGGGKQRAVIIEGDFGGGYHLVLGVGRHRRGWGRVVRWWGIE